MTVAAVDKALTVGLGEAVPLLETALHTPAAWLHEVGTGDTIAAKALAAGETEIHAVQEGLATVDPIEAGVGGSVPRWACGNKTVA